MAALKDTAYAIKFQIGPKQILFIVDSELRQKERAAVPRRTKSSVVGLELEVKKILSTGKNTGPGEREGDGDKNDDGKRW